MQRARDRNNLTAQGKQSGTITNISLIPACCSCSRFISLNLFIQPDRPSHQQLCESVIILYHEPSLS